MSDGEAFMNRPVPEHLADKGFKPVRGASSFSQTRPAEAREGRDASPNPYSGATARVKARLEADDGSMAKLFGVVLAPTVDDRREHDVIDQAIAGVVEQATHGRPSRTERDRGYLKAAREGRAQAEAAAKTAKREARWAKQEARDARIKEWLEGKTEEQINAFLSSEKFAELPEHSQNLVHFALDAIQMGNEAEVDIALEEDDNSTFEFPGATEPMPWENRVDEEDDYSDTDDDDPGLTDDNYTET